MNPLEMAIKYLEAVTDKDPLWGHQAYATYVWLALEQLKLLSPKKSDGLDSWRKIGAW